MSHVERRVQAGRVTYRVRWRDPIGRERKRSFNRKTDAQRFLVGVEMPSCAAPMSTQPRAR